MKNKLELHNYIGKYIVLITNYTVKNTFKDIAPELRIVKYKQKYVLARTLKEDDLKDEDFVDYLSNMWKTNSEINNFLKNGRASKPEE